MKKGPIIAIVLLAAIILIPLIIKLNQKEPDASVKVKVVRDNFNITVKTTGELMAENSEDIKGPLVRKIGIWQIKINDLVPEGTVVDSGDYVGELDRSEIGRRFDERQEQLQKVQTQYEKTKLDTALDLRQLRDNLINLRFGMEEAQIRLDESKYESPATIRQAKISLEKAQRSYNQAVENYELKKQQNEAQMQEVTINLSQQQRKLNDIKSFMDKFTIYAPKSGMVIYQRGWGGQKKKVGSEIDGWNPVVATLPDMSSMLSKTFINEIEISKIRVGQEVEVEVDAFPGKKYQGVVTEVANVGEDLPNTDAKVFEVIVKILETDSILKPNMTSSNTIQVGSFKDVLSVPLECIHNNDSLSYVFKDQSFSRVKQIVETGISNENSIIVLNGLKEKDVVYMNVPKDAESLHYEGLDIYKKIQIKKDSIRRVAEEKKKRLKDSLDKFKQDNSDKKQFEKFFKKGKGKNIKFSINKQ